MNMKIEAHSCLQYAKVSSIRVYKMQIRTEAIRLFAYFALL